MKENLLLFIEASDQGGIQVMSEKFIEIFNKKTNDINHIILLKNKIPPKKYQNVKFYCCGSKSKHIRRLKFIYYFFKIIFKKNVKKVFAGHISLIKPYYFLYPLIRKKYSFISYGIEIWNPNKLEIAIIQNASEIYYAGSYTKEKMKKYVNSKLKVKYLYPIADEKRFFPKKKKKSLLIKYKLKEDTKIILTVSRLDSSEDYKGYDKVIEALPEIKKNFKNIKYMIVGTGNDEDRIKKLIKVNNLEDTVILTGFVKKDLLIDYFNLCDVFAMPSMGEGFGMVFVEALLCGKPVIAGNKDGSVDALQDGKVGLLIDPKNKKELENALNKVLSKEISPRLLDSKYLREKTIKEYGQKKFYSRVKNALSFFNKK